MRRSRRLITIGVAFAALLAVAVPSTPALAALEPNGVLNVVKVAPGRTKTLFENRFFKVTGTCRDEGGGSLSANTFIRARRDNALLFVSADGSRDLDFDRSNPRVPIDAFYYATGPAAAFQAYDDYQEAYAISRSGKVLIVRTATGVHVLGAACTFSGLYQRGDRVRNVVKVRPGATKTLFENKRFRVLGTCTDSGGGDLSARTLLRTKRDNAIFFRSDASEADLDFDRVDGDYQFDGADHASGTAPDFVAEDYEQEAYAVSRNGNVLIARVATGVHVLGGSCTFSGLFLQGGRVLDVMKVAAGAARTLYQDPRFRVVGTCADAGGGDLTARTEVKTKRADALLYTCDDGVGVRDFDSADGLKVFESGERATGTNPDFQAEDFRQEFYAVSRGGTVLMYRTATGVHVLGADCSFSGLAISG